MSEQSTASEAAEYDRLRARWEKAKADGTTAAFARELYAAGETPPMPPSSSFGSAEEQAAYEAARTHFGPDDLLEMLPYVFDDVRGVPIEDVCAELGIDLNGDESEGDSDGVR